MPDIIDTNYYTPFSAPTGGASFGAAVREGLDMSPLAAIIRSKSLGYRTDVTGGISGFGVTEADEYYMRDQLEEVSKSHFWINREEATAKLAEHGLVPDDVRLSSYGANTIALDLAIEYASARKKRQRQMSELGGVASFTGELLGSAVDPVGLLTNFIPVVGQARYARMLQSAGTASKRALIRASVGAAEGMVGAAITEPFVMDSMREMGADYTASDMLTNIVFGGIVGGGLHAGLGVVGDVTLGSPAERLARADPVGDLASRINELPEQAKNDLLKTALADGMNGRNINVEPILSQHAGIMDMNGPLFRKSIGAAVDSAVDAGEATGAAIARAVAEADPANLPPKLVRQLRNATSDAQIESVVKSYMQKNNVIERRIADDLGDFYGDARPASLGEFLRREGGLSQEANQRLMRSVTEADQTIDVSRSRFYKKNAGMDLDTAIRKSVDAGYFEAGGKRVSPRKFIDALQKEEFGSGYYRPADAQKVAKFKEFVDKVKEAFEVSKPDPQGTLLHLQNIDDVRNLRGYSQEFMDQFDELAATARQDADAIAKQQKMADDLLQQVESIGDDDLTGMLRRELEDIDEETAKATMAYTEAINCILQIGVP